MGALTRRGNCHLWENSLSRKQWIIYIYIKAEYSLSEKLKSPNMGESCKCFSSTSPQHQAQSQTEECSVQLDKKIHQTKNKYFNNHIMILLWVKKNTVISQLLGRSLLAAYVKSRNNSDVWILSQTARDTERLWRGRWDSRKNNVKINLSGVASERKEKWWMRERERESDRAKEPQWEREREREDVTVSLTTSRTGFCF